MELAEAITALEGIGTALAGQFPENPGRLAQLASALATAKMAVEHLFDEEDREAELVARVSSSQRQLLKHGHQTRTGLEPEGAV